MVDYRYIHVQYVLNIFIEMKKYMKQNVIISIIIFTKIVYFNGLSIKELVLFVDNNNDNIIITKNHNI